MVILGRGIDGLSLDTDSLIIGVGGLLDELTVGTLNQVLTVTGGGVAWTTSPAGLQNIVEDLTPQLGAQLDVNGFPIGDGTRELLKFIEDGSAVNEITIANAATGSDPSISATGDDTNINLLLKGKGIGDVVTDNNLIVSGGFVGFDPNGSSYIENDMFGILHIAVGSEPNEIDFHMALLSNIDEPVSPTDATTKNYVDTQGFLINVVEDLTPQLGGNLDAQGAYKIINLVDPTLNQDAATKFYVDTEIADLVDSSPTTLDTLNELAAALGDDPNFATTVTNAIAAKVAKSGDTMTGFLVLNADPVSNLQAATKQYVDNNAGETNTVSNLAGGSVGVYKQKTGVNFELRPLVGTGGTTVSLIGDVITINSTSGTVTSISTGIGLTGGPITSTGTIDLDINSLTTDAGFDGAADFLAYHDTSTGSIKKVLINSLGIGDLLAANNLSELTGTQTTARSNIGAASATALSTHISDTANPHSVTAAQTGAVAKIGDTMSGALQFNSGASLTSDTGVTLNIHAASGAKTNIEGNSIELQGTNGTGGQLIINSDGSIQLRPALGFDLTLGDDIIMPFNIGTTGQILQVNGGGTALEFTTSTALQNIVEDLTPQLGGDLDVQTRIITTSTVNGDITLSPNGTGRLLVGVGSSSVITSDDAATSSNNPGYDISLESGDGDGTGDGGNIFITPGTAPGAGTDGYVSIDGLIWPLLDGSPNQVLSTDGFGNLSFASVGGLQNLWETITSDSGSTVANASTDTLTVAGGTGISTSVSGDTLTITNDSPNADQNIWLNVTADTGTTAANTTSDTLTVTGGTNVTTTIVGDTLTIDSTGTPDQNIWLNVTADSGTTAANTTTDTLTVAGGTGISTAVSGDTLTITNDSPNVDQNIWATIDADTGSTAANTTSDTLTISGGTNVTTTIVGDTLTIDASGAGSQNLFETIVADSGSTTADITTDTLNIVGGTNVTTSITGDTLTINASGGGGGATEERFKLNYATNGDLSSISSTSAGVNTTTILSPTGGDVEIDFTGHAYPPSSIIIYGYAYSANEYVMKFPDATFANRKIAGGGVSGSPTAFGSFTTKITLTLREADTGSSRGFGTTTHAWIMFIFGD